ncbi:unnamed protein product [Sphenostylis stenocarpa]|uniref:Disease resistance protein At4g27190-like leucine-rich repeats domain-containing protein n=1 Tax=Sphenostylis stenocarpa TaxID=92480 RepID=A0AA86VYB3_9FABA|nr:unnamed protein product [Sphenostylis stenocarpa]
MKRLKEIWAKFPLRSFGKLDALIIDGCNKLEHVFPSYMVGRFQSVCNLKVTDCKSLKVIFDLKGCGCGKPDAEDITNLQNFHVEALPKLEHVWNKDPKGILNFKNLKSILVQECLHLEYIFPLSIAMDLEKLECLEVQNCGQLKEIVSRVEANNMSSISFEFPKLTTARFLKLPNLESFYGGTHEICCSALNNLSVELCHKLELFRKENTNSEIEPVFLPEKVIYNLKSMQIEPQDADWLMTYMGNYRMHKLKEFQLSRLVDTKILYFFLHRNPNLKSLLLSNCFFEQLLPPRGLGEENLGVVPKLKCLKLMNLPSLKMIGFEEDTILFQKLECLILKECPCLNNIPSSMSFTYLTNLEVSNCNKLSYLMTTSTAKSLLQLTTMKVTQCESMETIVSDQENKREIISEKLKETKPRISFKQLKAIELITLHALESFYSSFRCSFEFPSLENFVVSECGNLKSFTYNDEDKAPILQQICDRDETEEKQYYWKGDLNATIKHMYQIRAIVPDRMETYNPYTILESSYLKTLKLVNIEDGKPAIPTIVFPGLKNLEELEVSCSNVEVIFDIMNADMKGYTLPLKKLTLCKLPMLTHVWNEDHEGFLSFQNLREVHVSHCSNLETLFVMELAKRVEKLEKLEIRHCEKFLKVVEEDRATTEAAEEFSFPRLTSLDLRMLPQLTCFYPGKAIFMLESLKLDLKNAMMLCNRNFPEDMLHELVELELDFDDVSEVSNFPFEFFEKASNLEYLQIRRCRGLEELFPSQPQLCEIRMPAHLTTIVHSAVSFSNLKQLSVKYCHGLKHLFTSSTARKLVHLEEMYVVKCDSIEKILAKELNETTSEAIKFERLNTIILDSLSSLKCFYSGSDTLQLPSLIRLLVWKCTKMKIFSRGEIQAQTFLGIQVSLDPKDDLLFHQDLNTTVKMIQRQEFFKALGENIHELVADSQVNVAVGLQDKWLRNLGALKLDKCILPYAIPSCIVPNLNNLKELEVQDSDKVEVIFDMNDIEIMETESKLKRLTLNGLSKLVRVWEKNRQGVLIFQNLQEVVVNNCESLQTLFPASLAKNLKELEKLEIHYCLKLQEIVENEEDTAANITEKFVFPCLKTLVLCDLPQVTYVCPQTFSLGCPALKYLFVLHCDELELFQSAHPVGEGEGGGTSITTQPLISDLKDISYLEKFGLDWKHISALCSRFRSEQFMEGLKYLNEIHLYYGADVNKKHISPVEILQRAPNLIEISIEDGNSPEIFHAQNTIVDEDGMLGRFKTLTLENVSALQSMESKDSSWLNTICEKVQELNVVRCPHLTTLVHKVSVSCLRKVSISNCPDLQYLFPTSVAKKLLNLEEITVQECKSLKEIVAKEGDETFEAIKFERLKIIALDSLPSLICFYSGSDTLHLPSLINVRVRECPSIKIFSQGVIHSESFKGIRISFDPDEDLVFHQDLNATVKGMFQRLAFLEALDERYPYENLKQQNTWLSYLVTVKLDKCILPYAIPTILPPLKCLSTLEVGGSDQVEVIFDMSNTEIQEIASRLKVLTLKGLSNLRNVWEMNSEGVLIFSLLREVVVSGCKNLQTLFPASLAKILKQLQKLEIDSCDKLLTIVEKEEGTLADATKKFVFPYLEKLDLRDLPQLTYFYPETFTLESPTLNQLAVLYCHELELFPSAHLLEEGEGMSISINRLPLISDLKVISNMKALMLDWKQISTLSLWFRSEQYTEDLEHLNEVSLSFFHRDENEKPVLPIELFHKAPNLEELNLGYCNTPEIFLAQNPKIGEDGMFDHLKILTLDKVGSLHSIKSEDKSFLNTISEMLHELNVFSCPHLTTLEHSVSFSCLRVVYIYNCPNLQYLFTFSAAKRLMNLGEIRVEECESVKEIVAKEGDATSEATEFEQLHTIALESLPSLTCFYPGSDTLHLPSLINVHIKECPNMKTFSQGIIDAESFQGIQILLDSNKDLLFHQDLNTTVKRMSQQQVKTSF